MIDVFGEFAEALEVTHRTASACEWLNRRGLTVERRRLVGGVAVMRATLSRFTWTFEPHEEGERVLVAVVWTGRATLAFSDPLDLVAWRPAAPAEHFMRLGLGTVLGKGGVSLALRTASPLRLFRCAEDFIRCGGERDGECPAAVLLNLGFAYSQLHDMPGIICDDVDHGLEVETMIAGQRPPLPPIHVPAERVAA
ncbi:hypothetical protein [Azospirillum sp. sgz301742]